LIALVPFIGWILGAVIGGIVNLVEMLAVLLDPQGRRIGESVGWDSGGGGFGSIGWPEGDIIDV